MVSVSDRHVLKLFFRLILQSNFLLFAFSIYKLFEFKSSSLSLRTFLICSSDTSKAVVVGVFINGVTPPTKVTQIAQFTGDDTVDLL